MVADDRLLPDPSGHRSDGELVDLATGGDRQAAGELLARHRSVLVAACSRLLGEWALGEDAAQEASLRAFLSLDRLRQPHRFGAWLVGIGLNVCRDWLRQSARERWSWDEVQGGRHAPETERPERVVEAVEIGHLVRQALAELPSGQRSAAALFYLGGLTHQETAALLGIRVGAVKNRLHKARHALRDQLLELWEEERMETSIGDGVRMRVADVWRRAASDARPSRSVVLLEEIGGQRRLPIWIGEFEATAIALHLEQASLPRPGTHELAARLLDAAGARLAEVRIVRLVDDTFYAEAIVEGAEGRRAVDARPSDALALAVLSGANITASAGVLAASEERAGALASQSGAAEYAEHATQIAAAAQERWEQQTAALRRERC